MVDIVQLVERQIVDLVVAGSSPVIHPIRRIELLALCDFFIQIANLLLISCSFIPCEALCLLLWEPC